MSEHKIKLKLNFEFTGPLFIGSGFGDSLINRKVIRNAKNQVYIPGSNLKGIVRNSCEQIANLYNFPVKSPHDYNELDNFHPAKKQQYLIERLFGSKYEGEKLFFRDANMNKLVEKGYDQLVITRNSIDRALGSAKEKHLFSTECSVNLNIFETEIYGYHEGLTLMEGKMPLEYQILVAGILLLDFIGGNKSIGSGRVKSVRAENRITLLRYNDLNIEIKDALRDLETGYTDLKEYYNMYREEQ